MFNHTKVIVCDFLVDMKLAFETDGWHEVLWCKVTKLNFGVRRKDIAIQFSSTISMHVCLVYLVDDKVFLLLVLSKEINMLCESEILSFFVYGVYQGGLPGGVSPTFPCIAQGIKLTLRPSTSRLVQCIVCGGFVDD